MIIHVTHSTVDGVTSPTSSTQVFYISVSVCCIVIFLVAIILAILHLHSMKRVEMEDRFVSLSFGCFKNVVFMTMHVVAPPRLTCMYYK